MNRFCFLTVVLLANAIAAGCGGGKQSVASRSAAAYREAVAKGIPVAAGGHGGHTNAPAMETADHSGMAGMDGHSMPGMEHGTTSAGDHDMANMPGMEHRSTAGMDHSKMQSGSMAGMDHSKMQSGSMAGMSNMAGMHHAAAAPVPVDIGTPATSAAIEKLNPSATLQQDEFDKHAPGGQR